MVYVIYNGGAHGSCIMLGSGGTLGKCRRPIVPRYGGGGTHKDFRWSSHPSPYLGGIDTIKQAHYAPVCLYMKYEQNIPLAPLTTFRIGGDAQYFTRATSVADIHDAITYAHEHTLPLYILGGGSNVLISDTGITGLVVKNDIPGITYEDNDDGSVLVTAGAGVVWNTLVDAVTERGLWGVENLAGIPGTVGAAPVQNIGAYGAELKDVLVSVFAIDIETNTEKTFTCDACELTYRESIFKQNPNTYVITHIQIRVYESGMPNISYTDLAAHFAETPTKTITPQIVADAVRNIRDTKFPPKHKWTAKRDYIGTAGSFFKNPIISKEKLDALVKSYETVPYHPVDVDTFKIPAAWCIEVTGLTRGTRIEDVGTWHTHGLVVVAYPGATATAVDAFTETITEQVNDVLGITLEREVTLLGDV